MEKVTAEDPKSKDPVTPPSQDEPTTVPTINGGTATITPNTIPPQLMTLLFLLKQLPAWELVR
ncbi:hypothetical protein HGP05_00800 [Streptococcus sanguinis]|uniref:Uncharacterized protein n=1 Tax=Streptococcus sanguinis TaxID=1305 RepID=A0A7Y0VB18_STRSA|nr:hypothetical protein [Streptococcus sanguinis]